MSYLKVVLTLSLFLFTNNTYAGDWLCWGGNPARSNFSPDTIIDPSADDFDLIWRDSVHAPGKVGGCPIIANGRVYVRDYMYYVCAYDLLTGEFLWRSPQIVNNPSKHVYGENNNGLCYGEGCLVYQTYKTIGCLD
ncbi:MAG: hypothetical protein JNL74_01355, partial [Fibrobacteres bacterium]|nr:hypothetical protein [Fibrobacterota bacterium]